MTHISILRKQLLGSRISFCRILILFLLGVCSTAYAASGTSTRDISEDGRTSTWNGFSYSANTNETFWDNGLGFATTTKNLTSNSGNISIKDNTTIYIEVPSKEAAGTLTIIATKENTKRIITLLGGNTISMTANPGASAEFTSSDIEEIDGGFYIKGTVSGGEYIVNTISVTLTNGIYSSTPSPECAQITLSFPQETYEAKLGETFIAPIPSGVPEGVALTLTYNSSKTLVASINENTGAVTIVGAGTTVISASFGGDDTYCAGEATYKLTVSEPAECHAPVISKQPESVSVSVNESAELSVEATGEGALSYQWYQCDASGETAVAIEGANTATYSPIPTEEGTNYYKVVVANDCGETTSVVVSVVATETIEPTCNTYVYYHAVPEGKTNTDRFSFSSKVSGNNGGTYKMDIEGKEYICTSASDNYSGSLYFTVGKGREATLYMCMSVRSSTSTITARNTATGAEKTISTSGQDYTTWILGDTPAERLGEGEWVISCTANYRLAMVGLYECGAGTVEPAPFTATLSPEETAMCKGESTELVIKTEPEQIEGVSYQWYKDGELIAGATETTYSASELGTYYATVAAGDYSLETNNAIVESADASTATIKRLTRFHYYRKGLVPSPGSDGVSPYLADNANPIRHLFLVESNGVEGVPYAISLNKVAPDGTESVLDIAEADYKNWLYLSNDTVLLDLYKLHEYDKGNEIVVVGDKLRVTATPLDACGWEHSEQAENIDITVVEAEKRLLAYIVAGGDGKTVKLGGDFIDGVNKANLCLLTGSNQWDMTKPGVLWDYLNKSKTYIPIAVNGYADYDFFNYEPFDIVLLTDYPKTDAKDGEKKGGEYINALADLVDKKPILSLKAHMSKLSNWAAKGFAADPVACADQIDLNILCHGHSIFHNITGYDASNDQINILTSGGFETVDKGKKGLQGFRSRNLIGFVNIGYIYPSGAEERYVACCERQDNILARLMILSVNAGAVAKFSEQGLAAVKNILDYLLDTNPANIQDCSNIFEGTEDSNWSNINNWTAKRTPFLVSNVHIHADCNVDIMGAKAGFVKIQDGKTLTVNADASLRVAKRMGLCNSHDSRDILPLADSKEGTHVVIKADKDGAGTLIHSASKGFEIPASVEYYSIASGAPNNCQWQWMTTPVADMKGIATPFAGAYLYAWNDEAHQFNSPLNNGSVMTPFHAYCFTQCTQPEGGKTYTIEGHLVNIEPEITIQLSYNETLPATRRGINVIGNSWTAPINISGWKIEDFVNCEATIILFNTGFDPTGTGNQNTPGDANITDAGQYVCIPINTAATLGKHYQAIPAMQAFQVNATGAGASLTMRYDDLVRTDNVNRQPMRMQAHDSLSNVSDEQGITDHLIIRIKGKRYADQVHLFRHADCTAGFDNGWDGRKILGAEQALQVFVEHDSERYAVSTQPNFVGTRLAFFKGEDEDYTMEFDYDGEEPLYLYDSNTNTYTPVQTGDTYCFRSETTRLEHRFLLTDYAPQDPTGPTTGGINIEVDEHTLILSNSGDPSATLSLYDAAGRLCHQQHLSSPLTTLPIPDRQGVYIVEITTDKQRISRKIVL